MPRYKPTNFDQITMIPVDFNTQLSLGTFEYTLSCREENVAQIEKSQGIWLPGDSI
jgi:hypothetical protein